MLRDLRRAMPPFASRLKRATVAPAIAMTVRARELRAAGANVIQLTIGEPDFATPAHAIEAAHAAALRGETKYPPVDGMPALKQAVQRKFARQHGLEFPLNQILIGNGGKQIIFDALLATVEAGDEVLIPAPYWSAYALMTYTVGGEATFVNCPQNNGFRLRAEDLDAAITPRTRWLFLNFPNNPTGAACSREDLAAIAAVMRKHPHVWILSDDMYEDLVYDGFAFTTLAAVAPDLRDRVLTVSGVSKSYAMTGWRIGYAAGPRDLIAAMVNMQGQATSGASPITQAAAVAALDGPQDLLAERAAIYRHRRDLVVDALNDIPGLSCHRPEGTFYVFPSVAGCLGLTSAGGRAIDTDEDFATALLEEAHVAVVSGTAFGMSPYLRLSCATDDAALEEGCRRIAAFVAGLR
jgi:aspartate aminotransferase